MTEVVWNSKVRLVLADVDQTIADDFAPAEAPMIEALAAVLRDGISLFLITGGPLRRVRSRIVDRLPAELRSRVLVAHCMGAEVWGFDAAGQLRDEPFYSLYDELVTDAQKRQWREVVAQLVREFKLVTHEVPASVEAFREATADNPFDVVLEDRGPQITFEVVNGYNLTARQRQQIRSQLPHLEEVIDFREPILARADELLTIAGLPIRSRFGGLFAVDFILQGVSKERAIKEVLARPDILQTVGVAPADIADPEHLEIWGDRFDQGMGTDWLMCQAVDPRVRAIDFRRDEDPTNFPAGRNIIFWPGRHQLHAGLLEYLRSRSV